MLKKIGLPVLALTAMLVLAPLPKASAAVRFGVAVGAPVYPYPAYPYANAYPNYPAYGAYPAYPYAAPVYAYPYGYWRDHGRREYGAYREQYREHGRYEHGGGARGYRR
jgi:hypothetical protein